MDLRIYFQGEKMGAQFKRSTQRQAAKVHAAVRASARTLADNIEQRVTADIQSAGNFSSRWTEAFSVSVSEGGGHVRISASFSGDDTVNTAWPVFEYGAVIKGNPLLWLPFDFADDAKGVWPRDYPEPLFRVDSKEGLPLLFTWTPGEKDSAELKYFGKEEVVEPQKFHIRDICRDERSKLPDYYSGNLKR